MDKAISDYDAALKTNPKLAGPLYGRGLAKIRKGEVAGGNVDTAAAKEINPRIGDTFAGYNVPAMRAETAPPLIAAPATASSTKAEPAAPPAETPTSHAAGAQPAPAPAPAVEITTSVTKPPRSEPVLSAPAVAVAPTAAAAPPGAASPAPAADCSLAETHWKSAESIGTLAAYADHLARFPTCAFSTLAAARIEALKK